MAARKRSKHERERDLARESELYLAGVSQVRIAEKIGNLSQQQISADLRLLQKRWQASALVDLDQRRGLELAKLDQVELTYWEAWEKADKKDTTSERWLSGLRQCIAQRCKLVGVNRPEGYLVGLATQERQKIEVSYIEDWRKNRIEQQTGALELQWPDDGLREEARDRSLAALAVAIGNAAGGGVDIIDGEAVQITETAQDGPGHAQEPTGDAETPQGIVDALQESQEEAAEIERLTKILADTLRETAEVESQIEARR